MIPAILVLQVNKDVNSCLESAVAAFSGGLNARKATAVSVVFLIGSP